jgi:hypothetical protein
MNATGETQTITMESDLRHPAAKVWRGSWSVMRSPTRRRAPGLRRRSGPLTHASTARDEQDVQRGRLLERVRRNDGEARFAAYGGAVLRDEAQRRVRHASEHLVGAGQIKLCQVRNIGSASTSYANAERAERLVPLDRRSSPWGDTGPDGSLARVHCSRVTAALLPSDGQIAVERRAIGSRPTTTRLSTDGVLHPGDGPRTLA